MADEPLSRAEQLRARLDDLNLQGRVRASVTDAEMLKKLPQADQDAYACAMKWGSLQELSRAIDMTAAELGLTHSGLSR